MTDATDNEVQTSATAEELARTVADRLVAELAVRQSEGRVPSVVLTGGTVADRIHRAVLDAPGIDAVDWSRVDVWFGDERFVPAGDDERNAGQASRAFLSRLPLDPARVHEMPASDGAYGDDAEAAASAYAEEVSRVLGAAPRFDVLMLGVGPDGHCASLFPGHEAVHADGLTVAVHGSPKPPPTRISLTMGALRSADEVWFVVSGRGKAGAVRAALSGQDVTEIPARGPRGMRRTLWLLDADAAAELPES